MAAKQISDVPAPGINGTPKSIGWGSDAIVQQLSRLNIPYMTIVPGSSFRGAHDSLVNFNENRNPQMLISLHEEHAIAIAHGYAKVTGKPLAVGIHANVGLMHASMAIYNAFCDRVPMLILGATGPLDAMKRRPWIDWIHTAIDQAAIIRPFIKFDDQPYGVNSAVRSLVKATASTTLKPSAPVYVCLDVSLQEGEVDPNSVSFPDTERYFNTQSPNGSIHDVSSVAKLLTTSKKPLFLLGRLNRSQQNWNERVQLAERFHAFVMTDIKQASPFPTKHKLHACPPSLFNSPQGSEVIRQAELVIGFEWVDLAGTLHAACGLDAEPSSKVVNISLDSALHNGWSKDHFDTPPADISITADADKFLTALLEETKDLTPSENEWNDAKAPEPAPQNPQNDDIYMSSLAEALNATISPDEACLIRVPLGWRGADLNTTHPLGFLGADGAYGIGSGPGQTVGAALALKDTTYLPYAVLGDGDYLMSSSALWTAARYRIPLLVVVANNGSYYNDEVHQERVAKVRSRPVENKWIGMKLDDPAPDLSLNARSLGLTVLGEQVTRRGELKNVLMKAIQEVKSGKPVLVDVRVLPDGYSSAIEKGK
ncbi:acetolactate synthase II [Rhizodiscina lignyota]|uniref:Acetolactate synthase II n=1 Tax=Rhizodiscina lignyota TaxID=1504668 RepID=A0A9P4IBI6_9PEZI|nr:acetolactate synthase II [Rhizodiscina lignyota]